MSSNDYTNLLTSKGAPAPICGYGSALSAGQDLILTSIGPPPPAIGLLFFGAKQIAAPLGDRVRCVGGLAFRRAPLLAAAGVLFADAHLVRGHSNASTAR